MTKFNKGSEDFDDYLIQKKKAEADQTIGPEEVQVTVEMTFRENENAGYSQEVPPREIHALRTSEVRPTQVEAQPIQKEHIINAYNMDSDRD